MWVPFQTFPRYLGAARPIWEISCFSIWCAPVERSSISSLFHAFVFISELFPSTLLREKVKMFLRNPPATKRPATKVSIICDHSNFLKLSFHYGILLYAQCSSHFQEILFINMRMPANRLINLVLL